MKGNILLVEDNQDSLNLMRTILTEAGFTVTTMTDGIQIVEKNFVSPDVIILDNAMPVIDGIALCKFLKIKHDTRAVPIIVISGNHALKTRACTAGAISFLPKPFCAQELLDHVNVALRSVHKKQFELG
jgi:two-component system phosphate regulon response regulator PhoB